MRETLLKPVIRLAGKMVASDLHLYRVAAFALARRHNRKVRVDVKTCDGFRMKLRLGEYPDGSMYFGIYEPKLIRLIQSLLRPGDCAIDAGANIGYVTMHLAQTVGSAGKIHSFEPLPDNAECVRTALTENGLQNVTVHQQGVGAQPGEFSFYTFADEWGTWHALGSLRPLREQNKKITCQVVRMDDEVSDPVRLIKIDVEGAEVGAIQGATRIIREHRPHIILESNPEALTAFGHKFVDIYEAVMSASDQYDAIEIERRGDIPISPQAIRSGEEPKAQCNIWFRPKA